METLKEIKEKMANGENVSEERIRHAGLDAFHMRFIAQLEKHVAADKQELGYTNASLSA